LICVFSGGNVPTPTATPELSEERYARKRILFVGLRWEPRVGAAGRAFRPCSGSNPDATLTIVGCKPSVDVPTATSRFVPVANTRVFEDRVMLCLPTTREAFGSAFVEASRRFTRRGHESRAIPEFVDRRRDRYLVDYGTWTGSPSGYRSLDDPALCRKLGRAEYALHEGAVQLEEHGNPHPAPHRTRLALLSGPP